MKPPETSQNTPSRKGLTGTIQPDPWPRTIPPWASPGAVSKARSCDSPGTVPWAVPDIPGMLRAAGGVRSRDG